MIQQETGAADAAHHQLSGGKRSRKSACPKRILQQQQHHQQQLLILEAKQNATVAYPETKVGCYWEDGVEEKRSRWEAPSACPQTSPQMAPQSAKPLTPTAAPVPAPLQLPLLPAGAKDDGGADLLRSLGTFSPQSLIPSLYAALGGRGGGGGGGGSGGGDSGGYFGFGGELEAAPQRGWPKTVIASATDSAPVKKCQQQPQQPQPQPQQQPQQPQPQPQQQPHQQPHQQRRGPRPYDPQSKPEPVRIITRKGVAYNRRPRSFYSADVKLAVIEFAEQHGASAAERHFNVPLSTVQSWMRHDNKARIMRQSPQQIVALGNAQQPALQPPPPPPPPPPPQPQPLNLTFPKPSSRR